MTTKPEVGSLTPEPTFSDLWLREPKSRIPTHSRLRRFQPSEPTPVPTLESPSPLPRCRVGNPSLKSRAPTLQGVPSYEYEARGVSLRLWSRDSSRQASRRSRTCPRLWNPDVVGPRATLGTLAQSRLGSALGISDRLAKLSTRSPLPTHPEYPTFSDLWLSLPMCRTYDYKYRNPDFPGSVPREPEFRLVCPSRGSPGVAESRLPLGRCPSRADIPPAFSLPAGSEPTRRRLALAEIP